MIKKSRIPKDLLEPFMSVGLIDFSKVDKELSNMNNVIEKLNYLAKLKEIYYDKFEEIISSMNEEEEIYYLSNFNSIISLIFSHWPLETPLQIPSFIFENQLRKDQYSPTFTNWFIDYNARTICLDILKEQFEENSVTKRRHILVKLEMNKIRKFEYRVNELFEAEKIKVHAKPFESTIGVFKYKEELEYLRIDEGHYEDHSFNDNPLDSLNTTSMVLAKYFYFKEYLNKEWSNLGLESNIIEDEIENSFSYLFKSTELFKKAMKSLIKNGFIDRENNKLKWIFTPTKEFTTKQTLIALCVVFEKKQYFKNDVKAIYRSIESEFSIKIDKGNFSRSRRGFIEDFDNPHTTNFQYTSLFKDLL